MLDIHPDDAEILKRSHKIFTKVEVYDRGELDRTLDVEDGNVSIDDIAIRRRATLSLTDPKGELTPQSAWDLLSPMGNEVRLYRGLTRLDGTTAEWPLITGGISDIQIDDSGGGLHIHIDVYDRARKISRARLPLPYSINDGKNYVTAIVDLLTYRAPWLAWNSLPTTERVTPNILLDAGADPWDEAMKMAESIGMEIFFDPLGFFVLQEIPEVSQAVWEFVEGGNATVLYVNKRLTDEGIYNGVIVTGESIDTNTAPVRAEAWDENSNSPTYRYGEFGEVPLFFSSQFIKTTGQAQDAANARLRKELGATELVRVNALVNPALDLGDTVNIKRESSKVDARYVVDKITIPLTPARPMDVSTRARLI